MSGVPCCSPSALIMPWQNSMFANEVALGVGAGLTVLVMRVVPPPYNALLLGCLGIAGIVTWYLLNRKHSAAMPNRPASTLAETRLLQLANSVQASIDIGQQPFARRA